MEEALLAWLRERFGPSPLAPFGLTDDAALLCLPDGGRCVATTDLLTDGVDFVLAEVDARRAGRKALAASLSDLAAMGARPLAALVSLALPRVGALATARRLYEGMAPLAERHGTVLAGGDTNCWDGPLAISVAAVGAAEGGEPWRRSGGRPGDRLLVTGSVGGSILGKHLDFEPRVAEALRLRSAYAIRAAIDISDGLALDAARLGEASGCGAELDLGAVPIAAAAEELARRDGRSPLEHALGDGEDFELLLAAAPEEAERLLADQPLETPLTQIGRLIPERGLWRALPGGGRAPLRPSGYVHEGR